MIIIICSFAEFNSIYKRLGVTLTERGESFYQPMMADIVADMESKSLYNIFYHLYYILINLEMPVSRSGES